MNQTKMNRLELFSNEMKGRIKRKFIDGSVVIRTWETEKSYMLPPLNKHPTIVESSSGSKGIGTQPSLNDKKSSWFYHPLWSEYTILPTKLPFPNAPC